MSATATITPPIRSARPGTRRSATARVAGEGLFAVWVDGSGSIPGQTVPAGAAVGSTAGDVVGWAIAVVSKPHPGQNA
jgi:hypothetical protein